MCEDMSCARQHVFYAVISPRARYRVLWGRGANTNVVCYRDASNAQWHRSQGALSAVQVSFSFAPIPSVLYPNAGTCTSAQVPHWTPRMSCKQRLLHRVRTGQAVGAVERHSGRQG